MSSSSVAAIGVCADGEDADTAVEPPSSSQPSSSSKPSQRPATLKRSLPERGDKVVRLSDCEDDGAAPPPRRGDPELPGTTAEVPASSMWERLPIELRERIFASDTDAAALCFALNSSFNRTAQAFLLRNNVLPPSLRRKLDETGYPLDRISKELRLERAVVYKKLCGNFDTGTGYSYEELNAEQQLFECCYAMRNFTDLRRQVLELIEENGGLSGLQGRIARERRRASYMQKCQGQMSQADAKEKLRRGLTVLGLPLGNPSKLIAKCEKHGADVMGLPDLMDDHDWKARDELDGKSAKIGLALVLNCSELCKMYIESSGTEVYNDEGYWGSLEELLQTRAHYQYLFNYTNGHFEHLVKDHAFEVWAEVMDKGLSSGAYVGAASELRKCARFGLPATLPWLAHKFANTEDALAAAFAAADPEESARRLKLREYRAERELQFEKSRA